MAMSNIQVLILVIILSLTLSQCKNSWDVIKIKQEEENNISLHGTDTIAYAWQLKKALEHPDQIKVIVISVNYYNQKSLHLLSSFVNTHTVEIFSTKLESLPSELRSLKKIRTIRLRQNKRLNMNQALSLFTDCNVEQLVISSSNLKAIPSEIYRFKSLINLSIENNEITALDDSLFLNLQQLELLNVGRNQISYISPEIVNLKNIREIDLVSNPLRKGMSYDYLDSIFRRLPVEYLRLTSCGFTEFPRFIEDMSHLKNLIFLVNEVDSIPEDLDLEKFNGEVLIDKIEGWNIEIFIEKYSGKILF